ncbi:MAG: DUF2207 domain-containing protein [Bacteroidales bacterium]|nr:DUF2207 domain-containing protein [Bacteroidales bacterium]
MKRILTLVLAAMLPLLSLAARDQKVRDVNIELTLLANGNAVISESWDVDTGDQITEWYLVRENLGDIAISRFRVFDGKTPLKDAGEWDVDLSRQEKAGRYGIVHKNDGVELCWGVGEYGDHVYRAEYVMERAVKSLNDYDMLHLQVLSPGLASPPRHARVVVKAQGIQLDTTNTRLWGFGYKGSSAVQKDGSLVFETGGSLGSEDSIIILLRFNKGLFNSPSVQERDFQDALDTAMVGASFKDKEDNFLAYLMTFLVLYLLFIRPIVNSVRKSKLKLGFKPKEAPWYRDVPLKGNLALADYIQTKSGNEPKTGGLPLAVILRLVQLGCLEVSRAVKGPATLSFTDRNLQALAPVEKELYDMFKEAAGDDNILQNKEFSKWAKKHDKKIYEWVTQTQKTASDMLKSENLLNETRRSLALTPQGSEKAKELFGLKEFLSNFTLVGEREAFETNLWKDYMVYGALFGIADRVAKQFKDIDPALFKETFNCEYDDFTTVVASGQGISNSVRTAATTGSPNYSSSSSGRGYGGSSSHGGGGGFSGGGHGGGGR